MKIQIKTIYGEIFFEYEAEGNTIKKTVEAMLEKFKGQWINNVDLSGKDLSEISFYNSRFYNSSFDNSSFDNSSFYNSSFDNSSFYNSSFYNSRFDNSSFDNSRFDKETLKAIYEKNPEILIPYRDDIYAVLSSAPNEAAYLLESLKVGRVDGTQYEGVCACLVGTIANKKGCNYKDIPNLKPNSNRNSEKFFMNINEGDTPENSLHCKLAAEWIQGWIVSMQEAFGVKG